MGSLITLVNSMKMNNGKTQLIIYDVYCFVVYILFFYKFRYGCEFPTLIHKPFFSIFLFLSWIFFCLEQLSGQHFKAVSEW
jgi:hypothetical protein